MVNDGPEWFAPKRFGFGAGLPIRWQGWAITAAFFAVVLFAGMHFRNRPAAALGIIVPAIVVLVIVSARTTRGGWRWRWGEGD